MKELNFKKIDAFTKGVSSGNPAGYVMLGEGQHLEDSEMLKVALELRGFVNEVGFVERKGDEFYLRFYSAECEVAFCGHATIAIMYDILKYNADLHDKKEVFIHVKAGKLSVFNEITASDAVYIMAPKAEFLEMRLTLQAIAKALAIGVDQIDETYPIKKIDGGLRTLLVPIKSLESCLGMHPDEKALKAFCLENEIDIIHVFTKETYKEESGYRTRVFAPKYGYLEDPATGSGNAAFGYYLLSENLWNEDLSLEQSGNKENANTVKLKLHRDNDTYHMLFGGSATTRIEGKYHLHI